MTTPARIFTTGERVTITYEGRTVVGTVKLASTNGVSLFLEFEALLGGFVGGMPVSRGDDGVFRDIVVGKEVGLS